MYWYFQFLQSSSKRQLLVKATQQLLHSSLSRVCGCDALEAQLDLLSAWCRPASAGRRDETDVCVLLSFPGVKCTASSEPRVRPADLRGSTIEVPLAIGTPLRMCLPPGRPACLSHPLCLCQHRVVRCLLAAFCPASQGNKMPKCCQHPCSPGGSPHHICLLGLLCMPFPCGGFMCHPSKRGMSKGS